MLKQDQQISMFGETIEQMEKSSKMFGPVNDAMYAMQILSDAQEVLERGNPELCRQFINKAKHFLSKINVRERNAMLVQS